MNESLEWVLLRFEADHRVAGKAMKIGDGGFDAWILDEHNINLARQELLALRVAAYARGIK